MQLEINTTSAELVTPVKQQQRENDQRLASAKENILRSAKKFT